MERCTGPHCAVAASTANRPEQIRRERADCSVRQPVVCPEACCRTVSQLHGHCSSEHAGDHSFWSRREASAQAESVSVLRSHFHLTSQAQRTRRFGIPRPPFCLGAHTMRHATRHFPPVIDSVPLQRKDRRLLSISAMAHADRQQQMETCTGTAERVVCVC